MRAVTVVTGELYEQMHELTRPLFAARWGVNVQAVRPEKGEHWANCKVRQLLNNNTLLIDVDVFPLRAPAHWQGVDELAAVYYAGEYNTGLVMTGRLSLTTRTSLERLLSREFHPPCYEQTPLQGVIKQKLDADWARLSLGHNPLDGWAVHFAGLMTPGQKLELMKGLVP